MDTSSLIVTVMPITTLIALFTGISPAFHRWQPVRAQPRRGAAGTRRCAEADRRRQAEGPAAGTRRS